MASVNKVIILGNLGRDPEVRYTTNGAAVCSLRLATTRSWKNRDSGERQEETEWHSVVLYDRLAEVAGEYLKKGSPVYFEGRLKTRKWQDKDGNDRYTTEIVAESMQLLGSRDRDDQSGEHDGARQQGGQQRGNGQQRNGGGNAPRGNGNTGGAPRGNGQRTMSRGDTGFDDMDDDIPF